MKTLKILLPTISAVKEFVSETNKLECECDVRAGRYIVDAKSLMGMFSMDLSKPLELSVSADDPYCAEFLNNVSKFLID